MTMNKAERRALKTLWQRIEYEERPTYSFFRRNYCSYSSLNGCWMVNLWGMAIGIESDGHTHS